MPPPKKLDLIGSDLRAWLAEELAKRGFAEIIDVTEALNFRLEERGEEIRIGKTAVGEFSKLLKDQRDAFAMAETLLADMDVQSESELHKMLLHMIATSAAMAMKDARDNDRHLEPKELMSLGRMLKDLMSSAGIREKLLDDERVRIAAEAREQALTEMTDALEAASEESGLSAEAVARVKNDILGVRK
ncbi:phage protein Gp27 family protein [uncultured Tateyamaria sp.]|uniref:phage protein Gp27 family protein n=1 Tax=uncultured Tateyamaria sp. TaxID=455651 RepID=UPI002618F250|nr:phage protein Gp27 family protein [uncultured Tateyamaria sp.]